MKPSIKINEESKWIIEETYFNQEWLGKYESIMCQGNGYMGIRGTTEEPYLGETRNTFVAGTFNKFDENEVTELPNIPDLIQMTIKVNDKALDLSKGEVSQYKRSLNLKTGEIIREFHYHLEDGSELAFRFSRFVSMDQKHVIAQKVEITSVKGNNRIGIDSGINGQLTNSGSQHFSEGAKHLFEGKYIQMTSETSQSNISMVETTVHEISNAANLSSRIEMRRRQVFNKYWFEVAQGETAVFEKFSNIHTTRDKEHEGKSVEDIEKHGLEELVAVLASGYDTLLTNSAKAWDKEVWSVAPITITSKDHEDQVAINFAKYHLHVMTPAHDNRMNIGAKGLSGEGYKGHTFWDTEIFMLPYFTYTHPEIAKSLLEFRYLGLEGAHKKASGNNYEGAQFPWEAAWIEDGETTPVWGAADIVTGKATKIWSGFIEQHITSDVVYGVNQYVEATGDKEFLETKGYEIILDTAKFWSSRLEWSEVDGNYQITDVIGPDEYKEHVDNNAFTNYTAKWNIQKAIHIYEELKENNVEKFNELNTKLDLDRVYADWLDRVDKIFIPAPNEDGIIPQDDTYLSKKIIDLVPYKEDEQVGTLFHEYNLEQVNDMQVTKQADVLLLIYLFENLFSKEIKLDNWNYYEPKTMHDSSLSLSTHSALAADLGELDLSYQLFKEAIHIDMGPHMTSSDEGIHAASLGGIWQMIVFGYGGVRALDGQLRIEPHLPENWDNLVFSIFWHSTELKVTVTKEAFEVEVISGEKEVTFDHKGEQYSVTDKQVIKLI